MMVKKFFGRQILPMSIVVSLLSFAGVYGAAANINKSVENVDTTNVLPSVVEQDLTNSVNEMDKAVADNSLSDIVLFTTPVETDLTFRVASFSWDKAENETDITVQVRFQKDNIWGDWFEVLQENNKPEHVQDGGKEVSEPVLAGDGATAYQVGFVSPTKQVPQNPKIKIVAGGTVDAAAVENCAAANELGVVSRDCWDPTGDLRKRTDFDPWNVPRNSTQAQVIGHTSGYAPTDFEAALTAVIDLYTYYTSNGANYWGDLPYHFITSQSGHIFEGRACSFTANNTNLTDINVCGDSDSNVQQNGGHAYGYNSTTLGTSALGNYNTIVPTAEHIQALGNISGWNSKKFALDPQGKTNLTNTSPTAQCPSVSQEFDVILPVNNLCRPGLTEAPGANIVSKMGDIRQIAYDYVNRVNPPENIANVISDSNLKAILNTIFNQLFAENREPNTEISSTDLFRLEKPLDLSGRNISDITGLEYAVNVSEIDLSNNNITQLKNMQDMEKLWLLDVSRNRIEIGADNVLELPNALDLRAFDQTIDIGTVNRNPSDSSVTVRVPNKIFVNNTNYPVPVRKGFLSPMPKDREAAVSPDQRSENFTQIVWNEEELGKAESVSVTIEHQTTLPATKSDAVLGRLFYSATYSYNFS